MTVCPLWGRLMCNQIGRGTFLFLILPDISVQNSEDPLMVWIVEGDVNVFWLMRTALKMLQTIFRHTVYAESVAEECLDISPRVCEFEF